MKAAEVTARNAAHQLDGFSPEIEIENCERNLKLQMPQDFSSLLPPGDPHP